MQLPYFIILLVMASIVTLIAIYSDMLRNTVFNQASFDALSTKSDKNDKPGFSLAKTQLAFWTVIVIGSFIYVVFFSGTEVGLKLPIVINSVNLTLLGIAAGTTVVGKAIDGSQQKDTSALTTSAQQNQPAKGFFLLDIISDETGVSVHRLQNVLWTIIVGVIYIGYVNAKMTMPDDTVITSVLLGLMGVSSAAYLGVKTTENTAPQPQPPKQTDSSTDTTATSTGA